VKATTEYMVLYKIFIDEIIAVEANRNNIILHLISRRITTYVSISELSRQIRLYKDFVRLHRSFIVAPHYIRMIKRGQITMENGLTFMVGDNYADAYTSLLTTHLLKQEH
jgi:two-component system response regulator LytT